VTTPPRPGRWADLGNPFRRRLSRRLVRAAHDPGRQPDMTVGELVASLGDRSFGWSIVVFGLVNLLPAPPGATLVTAIPLVLVTGQMALGLRQLWLPGFIMRRAVGRRRFQRLVLWLGPVIRPIERLVRPRRPGVFAQRAERLLGILLFLVSVALMFPIPLSSYLPAIALFVAGIGLVERDGVVTLIGAAFGVVSIVVTATVTGLIVAGVLAVAHG
jgi:hypothetical protein